MFFCVLVRPVDAAIAVIIAQPKNSTLSLRDTKQQSRSGSFVLVTLPLRRVGIDQHVRLLREPLLILPRSPLGLQHRRQRGLERALRSELDAVPGVYVGEALAESDGYGSGPPVSTAVLRGTGRK